MTNTTPTNAIASSMDDSEVSDYLINNPEFFSRNPEVLVQMRAPGEMRSDGAIDFQAVMVDRLRDEIQNLAACTQDVIETSRVNMTYLTRTHAATLALLSAQDGAHMARIITHDLPLLLDVEYVAFGFEQDIKAEAGLKLPGARMLPFGYIEQQIGEGGDVFLIRDMIDDGTLFGDDSPAVRSAAVARLRPGTHTAGGVLALGSTTPGMFHPGQGTDLLNFLARVTEKMFMRWLAPAD